MKFCHLVPRADPERHRGITPPYDVYRLQPAKVLAFGATEAFSPTRWRF